MSAQVMDGRRVARMWKENVAARTKAFLDSGVVPQLTVVLVGSNPASEIYVRNK